MSLSPFSWADETRANRSRIPRRLEPNSITSSQTQEKDSVGRPSGARGIKPYRSVPSAKPIGALARCPNPDATSSSRRHRDTSTRRRLLIAARYRRFPAKFLQCGAVSPHWTTTRGPCAVWLIGRKAGRCPVHHFRSSWKGTITTITNEAQKARKALLNFEVDKVTKAKINCSTRTALFRPVLRIPSWKVGGPASRHAKGDYGDLPHACQRTAKMA